MWLVLWRLFCFSIVFSAGFVFGCWWYCTKIDDVEPPITNMDRPETGEVDSYGIQ